jgi:hypothetical protein
VEEPPPSSAEEEELAVFPDLDYLRSTPPRSPPLCPEPPPSSVEEPPPSSAEEEELAVFPDLDRLQSRPCRLPLFPSSLPRRAPAFPSSPFRSSLHSYIDYFSFATLFVSIDA